MASVLGRSGPFVESGHQNGWFLYFVCVHFSRNKKHEITQRLPPCARFIYGQDKVLLRATSEIGFVEMLKTTFKEIESIDSSFSLTDFSLAAREAVAHSDKSTRKKCTEASQRTSRERRITTAVRDDLDHNLPQWMIDCLQTLSEHVNLGFDNCMEMLRQPDIIEDANMYTAVLHMSHILSAIMYDVKHVLTRKVLPDGTGLTTSSFEKFMDHAATRAEASDAIIGRSFSMALARNNSGVPQSTHA